jgi:hypothetical protein
VSVWWESKTHRNPKESPLPPFWLTTHFDDRYVNHVYLHVRSASQGKSSLIDVYSQKPFSEQYNTTIAAQVLRAPFLFCAVSQPRHHTYTTALTRRATPWHIVIVRMHG